MQSNIGKMPKGIEMSARGLRKWQDTLTDCNIAWFLQKLEDAQLKDAKLKISELTARKAFKGEKVAYDSWEKIFTALKLDRKTFFTDAEWNGWDEKTLWKHLWALAEDADDRFGWVLPEKLKTSGAAGDTTGKQSGYQKRLSSGKNVLLEIPAGLSGYLILVERDENEMLS